MKRDLDRWFRVYARMIDSPQMLDLSDAEFRLIMSMWCLAATEEMRGQVHMSPKALRRRALPDHSPENFDNYLGNLTKLDLIQEIDGGWEICRWNEHQYEKPSDTPEAKAERQRNKREKDKQSTEDVSRACHAHVTPESRPGHAAPLIQRSEIRDQRSELDQDLDPPNPPNIAPDGGGELSEKKIWKRTEEEPEPKANSPSVLEIPESLNTQKFKQALDDWQKHYRERGWKFTSLQRGKLLEKLAEIGPERAVAAIDHSIASGYKTPIEASGPGGGRASPETYPQTIARHEATDSQRVRRYRNEYEQLGRQPNSAGRLPPVNEWLARHLEKGTFDRVPVAQGART